MGAKFDVPFFTLDIGDDEIDLVAETLRAGWLGQGKRTLDFEAAFAAHEGTEHAIATNSCTSALHTAVAAMGAGPGQGVLVPTHTWVSTAEAVANEGAVPIFVDCDPVTQQIDLDDARKKIGLAEAGRIPQAEGQRLEIVGMMVVYYSGLIPDERPLRQFAEANDLWWITDAAHSVAAYWQDDDGAWQPCGAGLADAYCYSFYPNKPMTTGDGGMITTRNAEIAERMRRFRNHGLSFDTWSGEAQQNWDKRVVQRGFKYTMTDVDASIGLVQLAKVDAMQRRRAEIAARFNAAFEGSNNVGIIHEPSHRRSSWHLYPINLKAGDDLDRDEAIRRMGEKGVDCRVHWRPLHLQPYFASKGWTPEHCPASSQSWAGLVSLPIFQAMTDQQAAQVVDVVTDVVGDLAHAV